MKVAFVSPRYGEQVVGGAERALRSYAEHLRAHTGWDVEVFTTCALDHLTWENELEPGTEVVGGLPVHRFESGPSLIEEYAPFTGRVVARPAATGLLDAERWIDLQGPRCLPLLDAVEAWGPDLAVFSPYLYFPAVRGVPRFGARAVLHPAAHDEPILGLPVFDGMFRAAGGLVYYSRTERALAEARFLTGATPSLVAGIGVDPAPPVTNGSLPSALEGRPFVLALGRVEANKGSSVLARFFGVYKARHPGPLTLVFAGPVGRPRPTERDDVVVLGSVDEATKWALLRGASALVSPSPFESFSLVLMEAWQAGTPVLVNARCEVTSEHVRSSGGGACFGDYASFEVALDRLAADGKVRDALAERGARYVEEHFAWPSVIERYAHFLERRADNA